MAPHVHGLIELPFTATKLLDNPLQDTELTVEFSGPSGQTLTIRAFWDGDRVWKCRFSPDEAGPWHWGLREPEGANPDLNPKEGTFSCRPYSGTNPLYRHGPLVVADNGRFFRHADGTPFFWLADTAWNGVIRGDDVNWTRYLKHRADQRFNAIQFVASHWRGDALDPAGEAACTETSPIQVNPAFFQRLDHRVQMINEAGLIAAPVALWALLKTDPGSALVPADAARLAAYIVARYDAYQTVWLLGGDGNYHESGIDRWKQIGREAFKYGHNRLATLHPCGLSWPAEEFRDEPWYQFIGYQSGHIDRAEDLQFMMDGPPSTRWNMDPPLPVLNLEPNYEGATGYHHKTVFTDYHVRRGLYWSLLLSPTAGVTYGHDFIWNWNLEPGPSEGHNNTHRDIVPPWHTALETPGIRSTTLVRELFESLDWTSLLPAPSLLRNQPGARKVEAFIAVSQAANGTIVAYTPLGGPVQFKPELKLPPVRHLVDPATGACHPLEACSLNEFLTPEETDSLLIFSESPN